MKQGCRAVYGNATSRPLIGNWRRSHLAMAQRSGYPRSVMHALSVDEFGLLNFFGTVPVQSDENVSWVYNDSAYEVTAGQAQISFALAPADHDVRIVLRASGLLLYELNATGVEDVNLHNDNAREWLEVIISRRQSIRLRITPEISLSESVDDPT